MRTWTVLGLATVVCGAARAGAPVHFADANLKAAVEEALWVSDPTATDMLGLTSLWAGSSGITDLTGLEYAENLSDLNLPHNEIRNIEALSSLTNLRTLALNTNKISSISALSGMSQLESLNLHDNQITSVSALSGLTSLRTLILRINQISDISALSGLTNLETLVLDNNEIRSLSALSGLNRLTYLRLGQNWIDSVSSLGGLHNLEYLDLHKNEIRTVSGLSGLTQLQTLILLDNQITDISALSGLTLLRRLDLRGNPLNQEAYDIHIPQIIAQSPGIDLQYDAHDYCHLVISSTAGGSVIEPGEGDFVYSEGESIRLEAQADPYFVFVNWSGNYTGTQNPTFLTADQDHKIKANFQSTLETIYVDDDAPHDPVSGDAMWSDPQENGTPAHPFDAVQEAIELAAEETRIVVRSGTYSENIDLLGKSLELTGTDPNDSNEPAFPVIDGGGKGTTLNFTQDEDPNCMVTGFVLRGGKGQQAGAILCSGSNPTIANCLIVGNRTIDPDGAAVYCADSNALFSNCTIADNYTGVDGTGFHLVDSNVAVVNSIIWNNGATAIRVEGAGVTSISYSDVEGGWYSPGNMDADPLFARHGYWAEPDDPHIELKPSDARAVWVAGDYHLKSQGGRWDPQIRAWVWDDVTSPCVDAGDPLSSVGQELAPNGNIINMGAYGGSAEASFGR